MRKPHTIGIDVRHEAGSGLWRAVARRIDAITGEPLDQVTSTATADGPTLAAKRARLRLAANLTDRPKEGWIDHA